jgi:DNA-binding CsgD family transcriptional regulator
VRYLTYWYQYGKPTAFCLIEATDPDSALQVHREAHGLIPVKIVEVDRNAVDVFLGPIREPRRGEAWEDVSLRTVMCIAFGEESVAPSVAGVDMVRDSMLSRGGQELTLRQASMLSRYASTEAALECALAVQRSFAPLASVFEERSVQARIGIHRSEPVTQYLELFGEAVAVASSLCDKASPGEILLTRDVRDACINKGFRFTPSGETRIEGVGPQQVFRLLDRDASAPAFAPLQIDVAPDSLSRRELEVLQLIAAGRTNQEIADQLVISANTVASHVQHIFDKTGCVNRADATAYALRQRLV